MQTLVVHVINKMCVGKTLDKTWQEIHDAFTQGSVVVSEGEEAGCSIYSIAWMSIGGHRVDYGDEVPWVIMLNGIGSTYRYEARTPNGYPEESYI